MMSESEWEMVQNDRRGRVASAGMGMVRVALLFGSAAVALALILTPLAEKRMHATIQQTGASQGLDRMSTGSTGRTAYTVRRSVLQDSPSATCIIHDNGARSGRC